LINIRIVTQEFDKREWADRVVPSAGEAFSSISVSEVLADSWQIHESSV